MRIITRPIIRWPGELLAEGRRKDSPFTAGWMETQDFLTREAQHLGAREVVIQLALDESQIRLDGWPYAKAQTAHPGVIISIETKDQGPLSFPCDRFNSRTWSGRYLGGWQANVRAVALAMEALRKVDRYGITRHGEQYVGWKALGSGQPIAAGSGEEPMDAEQAARILLDAADLTIDDHRIVQVLDGGDTRRDITRLAMKNTHPDRHGGDDQAFKLVERAKRTLEAV